MDDLAYRWDGVTVPAGGTVAYLSYEIQRGLPGGDGAAEDEAARLAALAYDANPLTEVYAGMSDQEIAAVRNWPRPVPTAAFTASAGASDRAPVALSADGSAASSVPGACSGLSYAWDLGDGATATGASTSHRFSAGSHTVGLAVTNSCGESAATSRTVTVADATPPAATLTAPRTARLARLRVQLMSSEPGTATLTATIPAKVAKRAGARTIANARASLQAGRTQTVRMKADRRLAKALGIRRVKVTLAVTVTDPAGNATKLRRRTTLRVRPLE